jgi:hypothetical protein
LRGAEAPLFHGAAVGRGDWLIFPRSALRGMFESLLTAEKQCASFEVKSGACKISWSRSVGNLSGLWLAELPLFP